MELLGPPLLTTDIDWPPIAVRSAADHLVVEVRRSLDRTGTEALAEVLTAAVASQTAIRLDLADAPAPSRTVTVGRGDRDALPGRASAMVVLVGGPGLLHLVRPGSCWTLDVTGRRLCRSTTRLQPRFVPAEHWTAISQLWLDGSTVTAVSPCGSVQFSGWEDPCHGSPAAMATASGLDAASALADVDLPPRRRWGRTGGLNR